jgi:hypothetical protein
MLFSVSSWKHTQNTDLWNFHNAGTATASLVVSTGGPLLISDGNGALVMELLVCGSFAMISRPPLMRYYDVLSAWVKDTEATGTFKGLSRQLRELRAVEVLIEKLPAEYTRAINRMTMNIQHYGAHEGGMSDLLDLRSIEKAFAPHPSRLYADEDKQELLAALMIKAYSVYERPEGASPLRGKTVVVAGDDRYVYTCPVTFGSSSEAEDAFFECEFNRDDLSLISARFERSLNGETFGRMTAESFVQVNEERDELLETMGLTAVPTI